MRMCTICGTWLITIVCSTSPMKVNYFKEVFILKFGVLLRVKSLALNPRFMVCVRIKSLKCFLDVFCRHFIDCEG